MCCVSLEARAGWTVLGRLDWGGAGARGRGRGAGAVGVFRNEISRAVDSVKDHIKRLVSKAARQRPDLGHVSLRSCTLLPPIPLPFSSQSRDLPHRRRDVMRAIGWHLGVARRCGGQCNPHGCTCALVMLVHCVLALPCPALPCPAVPCPALPREKGCSVYVWALGCSGLTAWLTSDRGGKTERETKIK